MIINLINYKPLWTIGRIRSLNSKWKNVLIAVHVQCVKPS